MTAYDRRFARDVAKQIERRRGRRRLLLLVGLLGAIALAITRLDCGNGMGLGGLGLGGEDSDDHAIPLTSPSAAEPRRCSIRVTGAGISVDGKRTTRDQAVIACKASAGADVIVTGDARHGDWVELEAALRAAGLPVFKRDAKQPPGGAAAPSR